MATQDLGWEWLLICCGQFAIKFKKNVSIEADSDTGGKKTLCEPAGINTAQQDP